MRHWMGSPIVLFEKRIKQGRDFAGAQGKHAGSALLGADKAFLLCQHLKSARRKPGGGGSLTLHSTEFTGPAASRSEKPRAWREAKKFSKP